MHIFLRIVALVIKEGYIHKMVQIHFIWKEVHDYSQCTFKLVVSLMTHCQEIHLVVLLS